GVVLGLFRGSARVFETDLRRGRRLRRDRAAARHTLRIALRAPYRSDHRPRSRRLPPAPAGSGNLEAGPPGRRLFEAASSAGEDDRRDRRLPRQRAQAVRRRCGGGSRARMHDHERRAQAGGYDGDQLHAGDIPHQGNDSPGVLVGHQPQGRLLWRQPDDVTLLATTVADHGRPYQRTGRGNVPSFSGQLATNMIDPGDFSSTPAAVSPKNSLSPERRLTPMTIRSCPSFFASVRMASRGARSARISVLAVTS